MSHRVNHHEQALLEHINEREWTQEDKDHFLHMIGRSALMSAQGVLTVLEFQQATDERIQAEKDFDRWAIAREFGEFTPEQFKATERYRMCEDGEFPEIPPIGWGKGQGNPATADAGWDDQGNYTSFVDGIERTEIAQLDQTMPGHLWGDM